MAQADTEEAYIATDTIFVLNAFDKMGFDLDRTGRARQTQWIEEQIRSVYQTHGCRVNIAFWDMHHQEQHEFNGGGFRVVVFLGQGYLRNLGDRDFDNWCCSGNQTHNDNLITFGPAAGPPSQSSKATRTLQSHHGNYLRASDNGTVKLTNPIEARDKWTTVSAEEGKIAFRSHHGNHLCSLDDGSVKLSNHVEAWEK